MRKNESNKLVEQEIKELLIKMHKGDSLIGTLNKIMETIKGIRYVDEKKFIYMLQGLHMDKIGGLPDITEDAKKIEGFNEAADENNFAVDLLINAITGEE